MPEEQATDPAADSVRSAVELTKKFIDNSLSLAAHTDHLLRRYEYAVSLLRRLASMKQLRDGKLSETQVLNFSADLELFLAQDEGALAELRSRLPVLEGADKNVASIHRNGNVRSSG